MKRVLAILSTSLLLTASAHANGLVGYGSYWDTKDADAGTGYGAKLALGGGKGLCLELRASYFSDLSDEAIDLTVLPLEAGLTFRLGNNKAIEPYVGGGGGYYMLETSSDAGTVDIDDEVGWYLVSGIDFNVSDNLAVTAEAIYRTIEGTATGDSLNNVTDTKSIDLGGLGVNVGLMLRF